MSGLVVKERSMASILLAGVVVSFWSKSVSTDGKRASVVNVKRVELFMSHSASPPCSTATHRDMSHYTQAQVTH